MKNISRRVFIKGMAVAAVATAASTVLTGCKLPTGEETVTEPVEASSYTFVDPLNDKNTLTVSAQKMVVGEAVLGKDKDAVATIRINNQMGQDVFFLNTEPTNSGSIVPTGMKKDDYYVLVSAYADGNTLNKVTVGEINSNAAFKEAIVDTNLNLTLPSTVPAKESVTVKFTLKKLLDGTQDQVNYTEVKSTEFTFKL